RTQHGTGVAAAAITARDNQQGRINRALFPDRHSNGGMAWEGLQARSSQSGRLVT
ncbi:unnamed protein product, partial [Closterium sp. Naga37s-1]